MKLGSFVGIIPTGLHPVATLGIGAHNQFAVSVAVNLRGGDPCHLPAREFQLRHSYEPLRRTRFSKGVPNSIMLRLMASARYELRKTASGYTVWDTKTGTPATVDGVWQVGLEIQNADDLTD